MLHLLAINVNINSSNITNEVVHFRNVMSADSIFGETVDGRIRQTAKIN